MSVVNWDLAGESAGHGRPSRDQESGRRSILAKKLIKKGFGEHADIGGGKRAAEEAGEKQSERIRAVRRARGGETSNTISYWSESAPGGSSFRKRKKGMWVRTFPREKRAESISTCRGC